MAFTENDLRAATREGVITNMQLEALLAFLGTRPAATTSAASGEARGPTFDVVHLLWYAGALIVIGAMGLFSTLAFSQMGGKALLATAIVYAAIFAYAGNYLWTKRGLKTPGGLLIAIAVAMAPLAVYGFQDATGMWANSERPGDYKNFYVYIKGGWFMMEAVTIAAAALALRFYRFPFIVLIAAFALWFMSMDIAPLVVTQGSNKFEFARQVSIWFGLGIIIAAIIVNAQQRTDDFAFWLYLFGVLTFWGAVSATSGGTHLQKAIYCLMNVAFLGLAVFLGRRVFAVFGTIGIAMYLGDLAEKFFKSSLLFPFALSLIGVGIIGLGLYYYRHQHAIAAWCDARMPDVLRRLRPTNAVA